MIEDNTPVWFLKWWRPLMAWQYFIICMFDFLIAPIIIAVLSDNSAAKIIQWEPLTLHGGGLYHISMMAIVGVTAWSRGQEKINYYRSRMNDTNTPDLEGYDSSVQSTSYVNPYTVTEPDPVQHLNEIQDGPEEDLSKPILIRKT